MSIDSVMNLLSDIHETMHSRMDQINFEGDSL